MITIVNITRHTYRKGTDLLIEIIPRICREYNNVNFILGGDGPKNCLLAQMVKTFQLQDRVKLLGIKMFNTNKEEFNITK